MKKLNDQDFMTTISKGISIIKFTAEWCGPCKSLEPVMEKLQDEAQVAVYEVDIDDNPELVNAFGIRAVPTVIAFNDGKVAGSPQVGARSLSTYLEMVEKLKNSSN